MVAPLVAVVGELLGKVLGAVLPDPAQRAAAQAQAFELLANGTFTEKAEQQLALAQIGVNQAEAQSAGVFKGGWRPGAGWVCVAGFAVQMIVAPLLPWVVEVASGQKMPPMPQLDTATMFALLGGLLGLGKLRSDDKRAGVA